MLYRLRRCEFCSTADIGADNRKQIRFLDILKKIGPIWRCNQSRINNYDEKNKAQQANDASKLEVASWEIFFLCGKNEKKIFPMWEKREKREKQEFIIPGDQPILSEYTTMLWPNADT